MDVINQSKAKRLYEQLDQHPDFYRGRVAATDRSLMNVVFNLPTPELTSKFLTASAEAGFSGLAGHRAVGGIRASIYNALTMNAVDRLSEFMHDFRKHHQIKSVTAAPKQFATEH